MLLVKLININILAILMYYIFAIFNYSTDKEISNLNKNII